MSKSEWNNLLTVKVLYGRVTLLLDKDKGKIKMITPEDIQKHEEIEVFIKNEDYNKNPKKFERKEKEDSKIEKLKQCEQIVREIRSDMFIEKDDIVTEYAVNRILILLKKSLREMIESKEN